MSGTRWPRYCAGRSAAAGASQTTDEPMASTASHVRRALGAVSFLGVAIGVSAALSPPEQPLDIGEPELDVGHGLALLWQILSGAGFPNQFFCDSWVVGFWRGRPWLAGRGIGKKSLDVFSSRFWIGWVTRRGDKCVHSTCRG